MRLIGLMIVRNEDWILGLSLRAALEWCNGVVVLDHGSTDRTASIIENVQRETGGIFRIHSTDPGWPEMEHRQRTLERGREVGGTHFAIIDADEVLTASTVASVRARIADLDPASALTVPMLPVWRTPYQRRVDDCVWTRACLSLAWRDAPGITWRPSITGYQHHARLPVGVERAVEEPDPDVGSVMHFQWADWERVLWKHRWYKMHEAVTYPDKSRGHIDEQYSQALDERGIEVRPIMAAWVEGWPMGKIVRGRLPWHAGACRAMWDRYGAERFEGLNLWGFRRLVASEAPCPENRPPIRR